MSKKPIQLMQWSDEFLYQRHGEIIAFARPDLAVVGTGSSSVAQVVDNLSRRRVMAKVSAGRFGGRLRALSKTY